MRDGSQLGFAFWFYPTRFIHLRRYSARRDWGRARAIVDGAMGSLELR
jgi:hypothetical protein